MSSGKTAALALNQWQLSDAFRMEEFNEDNQKLDAAVAAVPYVKLMDVTTTANAQTVELDLSGVDTSKFAKLELFTAFKVTNGGSAEYAYIYMRLNDVPSYAASGTESQGTTQSFAGRCPAQNDGSVIATFHSEMMCPFVKGLAKNYLLIHSMGSGGWGNRYAAYMDNATALDTESQYVTPLKKLSFTGSVSNVSILSGTRFILYGVKL